MPLNVIRSLEPDLLTRLVHAIPPRRLVADMSRIDKRIYFRYFKGYRADKVTRNHVLEAVRKEVLAGNDQRFAEILILAWNAAHWNLYEAMRQNVAKINPNVEAIERIEDDQAKEIIADLHTKEFEPEDIYLCTILNEVRFTPEFRATIRPGAAAAAPAEAAEEPSEAAPVADATP